MMLDTVTPEQVIAVPRISQDSIPLRTGSQGVADGGAVGGSANGRGGCRAGRRADR